MSALVDGNEAYQSVKLFILDWDTWKDEPVRIMLDVPRRSTLIAFKDGDEVTRSVAQTQAEELEALFKAVL